MPHLVIAHRYSDVQHAKRFGLVPHNVKYLPGEESVRGYRNATVYVVKWPSRWFSANMSRADRNRMIQLSRMERYLEHSDCEFINVTLP